MSSETTINALVFAETALAVPQMLVELFNDNRERPRIQATTYHTREALIKIYKERGDATQTALPVLAAKNSAIGPLEEGWVSPFILKHDGVNLAVDENGYTYKFTGKQVLMQYSVTLFTNDFNDVIDVAARALLFKPEISFELTIPPGIRFINRVTIDPNLSIPELNAQPDITKFEFEFAMQIISCVGEIKRFAPLKEVVIGGGPVVENSAGKIIATMGEFNKTIEVEE